jgi:hypothetical protein
VFVGRLPGVVTAEQVQGWDEDLREFFLGFSPRFSRVETRWQAWKYVRALMAPVERRNGWTLAEQAGDDTPGFDAGVAVQPVFRPGRGS